MKVWKYMRKPFLVDAVQVTIENLEEVAKWCDGVIREASPRPGQPRQKYVKVRVLRPLNEKQTMAFPGDFVLHAGAGFKIYTAKAFMQTFDPAEDDHNYGEEMAKLAETCGCQQPVFHLGWVTEPTLSRRHQAPIVKGAPE